MEQNSGAQISSSPSHNLWSYRWYKDLTKLMKPLSIDLLMKVFKVKQQMLGHIKNCKHLLDL